MGAVLALASYPTFDPQRPGDYPAESRRNRVLTDPTEPGSTFKAFIISGALEGKCVGMSEEIDCEHGVCRFGGRTIRDVSPLA
jgi:cell division protein FtsI (penicillin-binding protein 3)